MNAERILIVVLALALAATILATPTAPSPSTVPVASVSSPFVYSFNSPGVLNEAGSMNDSTSPYFWVNSGAGFIVGGGVGETVQGALPSNNYWRLLYGKNNPLDTGDGYYPQNLFRLVTRADWGNASEQVYFNVTALNNTDTPNRDGYSGVLLFGRYQDGNNLYYAGVRDDGAAVIKKKIGGTYYTLAQVQIFGVVGMYNKITRPSLLPLNQWMGLKMSVQNAWDGSVLIRLYLDRTGTGSWVSILSARDSGIGGAPFTSPAHAGIRTDYMDVQFKNFRIDTL